MQSILVSFHCQAIIDSPGKRMPTEGLPRSDLSVDMRMGVGRVFCLLRDAGGPSPLWVASFPEKVVLGCIRN